MGFRLQGYVGSAGVAKKSGNKESELHTFGMQTM
jgi:hypothetical protein